MKKTGAPAKTGKFCHRFRKSTASEQSGPIDYDSLNHLRNVTPLVFRKMFYKSRILFIDNKKQMVPSCYSGIENKVKRRVLSARPDWLIASVTQSLATHSFLGCRARQ